MMLCKYLVRIHLVRLHVARVNFYFCFHSVAVSSQYYAMEGSEIDSASFPLRFDTRTNMYNAR
jgi:hypothetical protein